MGGSEMMFALQPEARMRGLFSSSALLLRRVVTPEVSITGYSQKLWLTTIH